MRQSPLVLQIWCSQREIAALLACFNFVGVFEVLGVINRTIRRKIVRNGREFEGFIEVVVKR